MKSPVLLPLSRPAFVFAASLLGLLPAATRGADAADAAKPPVAVVSTDESVQKELAALDKALDLNPKLEEQISANIDRLNDEAFRAKNPEIDQLIKLNPGLPKALKIERHFLVHRAIARLARARVTRDDAKALDQFLDAHVDIRSALERRPGQIVQQDFLIAHPQLAHFFEAHPALSTVLLQQAGKQAEKKAANKAKESK